MSFTDDEDPMVSFLKPLLDIAFVTSFVTIDVATKRLRSRNLAEVMFRYLVSIKWAVQCEKPNPWDKEALWLTVEAPWKLEDP